MLDVINQWGACLYWRYSIEKQEAVEREEICRFDCIWFNLKRQIGLICSKTVTKSCGQTCRLRNRIVYSKTLAYFVSFNILFSSSLFEFRNKYTLKRASLPKRVDWTNTAASSTFQSAALSQSCYFFSLALTPNRDQI